MAIRRLSDVLGVSDKDIERKGVFNSFVGLDSKLHVDPSLLSIIKIKEFAKSSQKLRKYFSDIVKVIENISRVGDPFYKRSVQLLTFHETASVALGYSDNSSSGSGIGTNLAKNILETARAIINAGVKDPEIFELIGLFEEGIGADRISDMTVKILEDDFKFYSQRVAIELKIKTQKFKEFNLPFDPETEKAIILVPAKLLRDLPIAYSWEEIDYVCKYNSELRGVMNNIIGSSWKEAKKKKKSDLREIILRKPEVLSDLIKQYREKPKSSYDFESDPSGEVLWATFAQKAKDHPLDLLAFKKKSLNCDELLQVVKLICTQFAKLIESNGWNEFLNNGKKIRNERFPQKLFFGVADVYCEANGLDITRESNAGIGALDFKVSDGKVKVAVEIKYSKNQNLINGYEVQLPAYVKSERACGAIYLVIRVSDNDKRLKELEKLPDKGKPHLIIVDGRTKPSASKRKTEK
jgi:hypothetical protein